MFLKIQRKNYMSKITVHRLAKGGLQNWKTDGLFSHDTNGKEKGGKGKVITQQ